MSFLLGDLWVEAARGSFVIAPGGTTHDFQTVATPAPAS